MKEFVIWLLQAVFTGLVVFGLQTWLQHILKKKNAQAEQKKEICKQVCDGLQTIKTYFESLQTLFMFAAFQLPPEEELYELRQVLLATQESCFSLFKSMEINSVFLKEMDLNLDLIKIPLMNFVQDYSNYVGLNQKEPDKAKYEDWIQQLLTIYITISELIDKSSKVYHGLF